MRAIELYPSQVVRENGIRPVKNLGWLLRNWNAVTHFTIRTEVGGQKLRGTLLIAWLASGDGDHYSTGWEGDLDHVVSWLRRPVFHGLKAYVDPVGQANDRAKFTPADTIEL